MNRAEITALLSDLLERDVLSGRHWAKEVKYRKLDGDLGRVDYMSFETGPQRYQPPSQSTVERGTFSCFEVKSCMEDYTSGHGLNFIGDWNYIVCPMSLYKQIPQAEMHDVGFYVVLPYYIGSDGSRTEMVREHQNPSELTPDRKAWRLHKVSQQPIIADRRHGTAELLYAMLKTWR